MPSITDMFPSLDFDTLNRGLNFINFSLPNSGIATSPNLGMDPGFQGDRFKDGIQNQSPTMTVEVNDQQLPKNEKEWDKLSMSERIEAVRSQATGMPIVSQIDLSTLRKVATGMDKKGMFKESMKLFKIAENLTKTITLNESETDGKHDENATVTLNVDKDGQPISITKNFQSIEEALEFYDQFILPGVEEVMALEGSMSHFGFDKEAMALRRFVRAVKMQLPEKKAQTELGIYQEPNTTVRYFPTQEAAEKFKEDSRQIAPGLPIPVDPKIVDSWITKLNPSPTGSHDQWVIVIPDQSTLSDEELLKRQVTFSSDILRPERAENTWTGTLEEFFAKDPTLDKQHFELPTTYKQLILDALKADDIIRIGPNMLRLEK